MDKEKFVLRLLALVLFIALLTPDIRAPPANDTPVTCTEESLSEALRRFESTIKAQKAVIVVGAEGSGSKLAALAAAAMSLSSVSVIANALRLRRLAL